MLDKGTFSWMLVAMLTFKSVVILGYCKMNSIVKKGDLLSNETSTGGRRSAYFGEPLVQMTTPHVALNCLVNCLPPENKFDNSAPQLSFSKNNSSKKWTIQPDAAGIINDQWTEA